MTEFFTVYQFSGLKLKDRTNIETVQFKNDTDLIIIKVG